VRATSNPSTRPEDYTFAHRLRVRFAETDAMGVVHHSRYLPYLEEARVEFLRAIGHPYDGWRRDGLDAAVIEVFVRYRQPLRFDDIVDVYVVLGDISRMTFQLSYLLTVDGTVDGTVAATAVTVHAVVTADGRPARLPEWLRAMAVS